MNSRFDEAIVAWLLGEYRPQADLGDRATLLQPKENETDRLPAAPLEAQLDLTMLGKSPVLALYGPDEVSREAAAKGVAAQMGRSLLVVDLPAAVAQADISSLRGLRLALRDARLTGSALYLIICQDCPMTERGEGSSPMQFFRLH